MIAVQPFEELLELLGTLPPEQILAFKASPATIKKVQTLASKQQAGTLSEAEKAQLDRYLIQEDLIMIAKSRALVKLNTP